MPVAPPSRCPVPGCHQLTTDRGRCADHQRKPWENPSANTRALTGAERGRFRRLVLERDPVCRCTGWCGNHPGPCTAPATQADHIVPIGEGGARTDTRNGQGLCASCHDVKTYRDTERMRARRRGANR
ncbi:HNH endonuclease [Cellulosimicrobium sp. CpK407]|uniref:HNH endonuclease n=1 Tax=Cellulosimicrobium sp. CpK407 TaxID=3229847 RepID=UPI003F364B55